MSTLSEAVARNDADLVTQLLSGSGKAELNVAGANGETVLHTAIKAKNLAIAELLLKAGANVNQGSDERGTTRGYTACHFAARQGDVDAIELLAKFKADLNRGAADGWAPIHTACFAGKSAAMQKLLLLGADAEAKNEHGMTPIVFAANHGRAADVRFLVKHGANPNFVDTQGDTLLHHALHFRLQEMFEGEYDMPECQYDVVVALAIAGAPVDKANHQGKVACTFTNESIPALQDVLRILAHNRERLIAAGGTDLNYISLLHAPVQAFISMGVDAKHAKDLFESMQKCDQQRLADKKQRDESRPAGGCPVMKSKKNKGGATAENKGGAATPAHPPMDLSDVPPGTDPSNGQCPFFQKKAQQEAHSAATAPVPTPAEAPQRSVAPLAELSNKAAPPLPSYLGATTPVKYHQAEHVVPSLTWAYVYENRTILLLMALSFFLGSWFEQRFGVRA